MLQSVSEDGPNTPAAFGHNEVTQLGGLRAVCGVYEGRSRWVGGVGDAVGFEDEAGGRFVQVQNVLLKVAGGVRCLIPRLPQPGRSPARTTCQPSTGPVQPYEPGAQRQRNCAQRHVRVRFTIETKLQSETDAAALPKTLRTGRLLRPRPQNDGRLPLRFGFIAVFRPAVSAIAIAIAIAIFVSVLGVVHAA